MADDTDRLLRAILSDTLGIDPARVAQFDAGSGLFGHLPELDSLALNGLLTAIEDRMGIVIDDEEVDADLLDNYGALRGFVAAKRAAALRPVGSGSHR